MTEGKPANPITLVSVAVDIGGPTDLDAAAAELETLLTGLDQHSVVCLPEYAGLRAVAKPADGLDVHGWCRASADVAGAYREICVAQAKQRGIWLLTGSLPAPGPEGLVNRAWLCTPEGQSIAQDKQVLTPWERRETPLQPGMRPRAVETPFGRLAVAICYDAEFPALVDALAPDVLLVPACTDSVAGQTRVHVASRARALEQQCLVVHAPLVGDAPACPLVDTNRGRAGIFAPPDHPFPEDGVLARAALDAPGPLAHRISPETLWITRRDGAVAPREHAAEARAAAQRAETLTQAELCP